MKIVYKWIFILEIFHCKVAAGQNYQTFDGNQYNFASSCRYQIATTTFIPAKVKGKNIEPFNISVSYFIVYMEKV